MAEIRNKGSDFVDRTQDVVRDRARADDQILDLIKSIQKDRTHAAELSRVDPKTLGAATQSQLAKLVGEQLKGQIPAQLAQQLAAGNVATDVLDRLMQRLANASSTDPSQRFGKAQSPEAARDMATDRSVPQQALRWTQFVQKVLHVPGSQMQDRAGSAAPKGEGTTLLETLAQRGGLATAAGLRSPKLVERSLAELSPGQRAQLMRATFGEKLAGELGRLGIQDPLHFVKSGVLPEHRAELSQALGLSRAHLLGLLMRAELLKIGPGRNGELGIRPEMLGPLKHAGLVMLGTLGILRSLTREELNYIYGKLRMASGGFAKAMKGGNRPPVKRDLIHWARNAGRKASDILLPDLAERGGHLASGDAQELIQAWYMENLLYEQLAFARRHSPEDEQGLIKRVSRDERDGRRDRRGQQPGAEDPEWVDDMIPALEHDPERSDKLVCFWITDFNTDPMMPASMRRMYVCIDPDSGAIIPQAIEASPIGGV